MSQEDDLFDVLESVHDEETFLRFLLELRDDPEASIAQDDVSPSSPFSPNAGEWENTTIERFFEAAVRWARASKNGLPFAANVLPSNPWRRCADILYAAKGYE